MTIQMLSFANGYHSEGKILKIAFSSTHKNWSNDTRNNDTRNATMKLMATVYNTFHNHHCFRGISSCSTLFS
jgi:hypothetical protein